MCSPRRTHPSRLQSGFTLVEMLIALGLLLVLMGLASQVFKIALDGTGRLTQLSEIDRALRMFEQQLTRELAGVVPSQSVLAIQANPAPAYWTHEQRDQDDNPTGAGVFDGIAGRRFSTDPLRENPTQGYDPLDTRYTTASGSGAPDGSYDSRADDNNIPLLPRADILMFVSNLPEERSKIFGDIRSDGPVLVVYNHAELGTLSGAAALCYQEPDPPVASACAKATDDWFGGLRLIPRLASGPTMDQRPFAPGSTVLLQDVARDWHLARRAVLLKNSPDPWEDTHNRDRHAHVLSPNDPRGNRADCVEYANDGALPGFCVIDSKWEQHYLLWLLGGGLDVVSPAGGPVSGGFPAAGLQDFRFGYEISQRFFGGTNSLDWLTIKDLNGDGMPDRPGAVLLPRNLTMAQITSGGGTQFYRGAVPAWWLARSHLDLKPPMCLDSRLAHYFLPNCASFKVEWTPNDIRLAQAGLPEVLWIDPFKEPGVTRLGGSPFYSSAPTDSVTPSPGGLGGSEKPNHLDEFEILAQKIWTESGVELRQNAMLGVGGSFAPDGSPLHQVHESLKPRFGLSYDAIEGVNGMQSNVFDIDPETAAVQPSYNTHTWYSRNLEMLDNNQDGLMNTATDSVRTADGPDPLWPKALRITVDVFDDAGSLDTPVRHVFVVPVGSGSDRKQALD